MHASFKTRVVCAGGNSLINKVFRSYCMCVLKGLE